MSTYGVLRNTLIKLRLNSETGEGAVVFKSSWYEHYGLLRKDWLKDVIYDLVVEYDKTRILDNENELNGKPFFGENGK